MHISSSPNLALITLIMLAQLVLPVFLVPLFHRRLKRLTRKWRYRLPFLIALGLTPSMVFLGAHVLLAVGVGTLSAFTGALWATARRDGLWEDNQPPAPKVVKTVRDRHLDILSTLNPTPPAKRLFDLTLAALGLILSWPAWSLSIFLVWFEDPGPLFFNKNSVGKGGRNFHQYKLRTMVRDAEQSTGPVMASETDTRILRSGRFFRKTALDELPQLFNILKGDMSFVGPRPQRTVLVHDYLADLPQYAQRHAVLPGLAGLAQVVGHYYLTPIQKLRLDRLYVRYSGLAFDLKLVGLAVLLVFWLRWHSGSRSRIPRRWIRFGSRRS